MESRRTVDATPTTKEWLQGVWVSPIAGLLMFLFGFAALEALDVSPFYDAEHASPAQLRFNQLVMAGSWLTTSSLVFGWIARSNRRHRYMTVLEGHLLLGRPPRLDVPLADVVRVRVGAPMGGGLKLVHDVGTALGAVSGKNRRASEHLRSVMSNVLVLDADGYSVVLHVASLHNAAALVEAVAGETAGKWSSDPFSDDELRRFGRFTQGRYEHA